MDTEFSPPPPPEVRIQFSTRGLFLATAIIAIYSAVTAVVFRRLPTEIKWQLAGLWTAAVAAIPWVWRNSLRAELKAYRAILRPRFEVRLGNAKTAIGWRAHLAFAWRVAFVGVVIALASFQAVHMTKTLTNRGYLIVGDWFGYVVTGFILFHCVGMIAEHFVRLLIRGKHLRCWLGDGGISGVGHLIRWRYIRDVQSAKTDPDALTLRRYDGDITIWPLPGQQATVEEYIREHMAGEARQ